MQEVSEAVSVAHDNFNIPSKDLHNVLMNVICVLFLLAFINLLTKVRLLIFAFSSTSDCQDTVGSFR
jgi:hypothetical protein